MRLQSLASQAFLLFAAIQTGAVAGSWTFADGTVSVAGKGAGVGGGIKQKYV